MNQTTKLETEDVGAGRLECRVRQLTWINADDPPPISDGESRLVMLKKDNDLGLTSSHAVMAEYGFFIGQPTDWTIYYDGDNPIINDMVEFWMELPAPPGA